MKFFKATCVASAVLASAALMPVMAQAEGLSSNIGAVSLYKSSGVGQDSSTPKKNFRPAVQGGVAYDLGNSVSTTATLSGAQTSKVGDGGKSRLVVGISKPF